ncbi:DUF3592 domain-containing protein [Robiginitalea sp. IMCC43444]|uniref:DUF3592 domain-containing protein n=1 Tax=Robiginitalea sp. IMCC43444 TaxID=3459121 RepID=UPI004040F096
MTSGEKGLLLIIFSVGVLLLAIGSYCYSTTHTFVEKAISVDGIVVGLQKKDGTSRPLVEYSDHNGFTRTHYSKTGTNPPAYFVGEKVKILYDPDDSQYHLNSRIDSTPGLWGLTIFLLALGSVFIFVSALVCYIIQIHGGIWFFRKKDRLEFEENGSLDHTI